MVGRLMIAGFSLLLVLGAGCGGDDDDGTDTPTRGERLCQKIIACPSRPINDPKACVDFINELFRYSTPDCHSCLDGLDCDGWMNEPARCPMCSQAPQDGG
jgi:hypothetical protein